MIEVRSAKDNDVEAMAAIYVNAAREGWAHILGASSLEALEPPVDRLRAEVASTDARQQVLVAEKEGRVIGFAIVRQSRDEDAHGAEVGELDHFYSDPAVWGEGAGRKLLAVAIETLREGGFTEATLWVAEENHRPRQIYEVAGWRYDRVTRDKPWRGGSTSAIESSSSGRRHPTRVLERDPIRLGQRAGMTPERTNSGARHTQPMYASSRKARLVPIEPELPQADTGAPMPAAAISEDAVALAYDATDGQRVAVRFAQVKSVVLGAPNDETLSAHPLYGRGLRHYEFAEVEQSPWIAELEQANRVHPSHSPESFADLRHFILPFHDSTFECVARSVEVVGNSGDALATAAKSIDPNTT